MNEHFVAAFYGTNPSIPSHCGVGCREFEDVFGFEAAEAAIADLRRFTEVSAIVSQHLLSHGFHIVSAKEHVFYTLKICKCQAPDRHRIMPIAPNKPTSQQVKELQDLLETMDEIFGELEHKNAGELVRLCLSPKERSRKQVRIDNIQEVRRRLKSAKTGLRSFLDIQSSEV